MVFWEGGGKVWEGASLEVWKMVRRTSRRSEGGQAGREDRLVVGGARLCVAPHGICHLVSILTSLTQGRKTV